MNETDEYMLIEFKILLPADVRALAKLPGALNAAIKMTGLTHSPITVRGQTVPAAAAGPGTDGGDHT